MRRVKQIFLILLLVLVTGYIIPQNFSMPVKGATRDSYNQQSFWAYPWGTSVTHKGVDIFAKEGTEVVASTCGLVVYTGSFTKGGNAVIILGPKWQFHYYAHLKEIKISRFSWAGSCEIIGTVGTTGNAKGKAPHLHYSIKSMLPVLWRSDNSVQGWKKMFYINPVQLLNKSFK